MHAAFDPQTSIELDGLLLLQRDLQRAILADNPVSERIVRIGDCAAKFRFVGTGTLERLWPAIAHLEFDGNDLTDVSLTVNVWDSASTGTPISPLIESIARGAGEGALSPRCEVKLLTNDRFRTSAVPWDGVFTLFDREEQQAYYWVRDADELPYWERGAPFRTLFSWWLSEHGMQCVHAGAVGTSNGALLLAGKGGSGKSTTCLACIGSDLRYLSDDYCVVSAGADPHVFSLYNTGKLNDAPDLERQPHFTSWVVNPHRLGAEKQLFFVNDNAPDALLAEAPIRAVIVPTVTNADKPVLARLSGGHALRALAPTSLFQLPGSSADALALMASLVRSVPCYTLETGRDLAALPPALAGLLNELSHDASVRGG